MGSIRCVKVEGIRFNRACLISVWKTAIYFSLLKYVCCLDQQVQLECSCEELLDVCIGCGTVNNSDETREPGDRSTVV